MGGPQLAACTVLFLALVSLIIGPVTAGVDLAMRRTEEQEVPHTDVGQQ